MHMCHTRCVTATGAAGPKSQVPAPEHATTNGRVRTRKNDARGTHGWGHYMTMAMHAMHAPCRSQRPALSNRSGYIYAYMHTSFMGWDGGNQAESVQTLHQRKATDRSGAGSQIHPCIGVHPVCTALAPMEAHLRRSWQPLGWRSSHFTAHDSGKQGTLARRRCHVRHRNRVWHTTAACVPGGHWWAGTARATRRR